MINSAVQPECRSAILHYGFGFEQAKIQVPKCTWIFVKSARKNRTYRTLSIISQYCHHNKTKPIHTSRAFIERSLLKLNPLTPPAKPFAHKAPSSRCVAPIPLHSVAVFWLYPHWAARAANPCRIASKVRRCTAPHTCNTYHHSRSQYTALHLYERIIYPNAYSGRYTRGASQTQTRICTQCRGWRTGGLAHIERLLERETTPTFTHPRKHPAQRWYYINGHVRKRAFIHEFFRVFLELWSNAVYAVTRYCDCDVVHRIFC